MPGETRVGLAPETVGRLAKAGNTVVVERGAGVASAFPDDAYEKAGAQMVDNAFDAELVAKVQKPTDVEIGKSARGLSHRFLHPCEHRLAAALADRHGPPEHGRYPRASAGRRRWMRFVMETVPLHAFCSPPRTSEFLRARRRRNHRAVEGVIIGRRAGLHAIATARRLGAVASVDTLRLKSSAEPRGIPRDRPRQSARRRRLREGAVREATAKRASSWPRPRATRHHSRPPRSRSQVAVSSPGDDPDERPSRSCRLAPRRANVELTEAARRFLEGFLSSAAQHPSSMPFHAANVLAQLAACSADYQKTELDLNRLRGREGQVIARR